MAQSTAEEIAGLLPNMRLMKSKGLRALLWRRNRGYLNRKATSLLFDILEVLSLALLTDIASLKYLYIIWIIFYFSQNILESLFFTARKIFIFEKKFPTKRTLAYVHILVWIVPFFFSMVSFEHFSHNNIAIAYLLYKAVILMFQTIVNHIVFEIQTLSRVYYPPSLNWMLLTGAATLVIIAHTIASTFVAFFLTLSILFMVKVIQDTVMMKRAKELSASILWQLKRNRLSDVNTIMEFTTLMSIEVFLPLSLLSLPHQAINIQNMGLIFIIYMLVKLLMRPIRSLMLDYSNLGIGKLKILIIASSGLSVVTSIFLLIYYPAFRSATCIGLIYFFFLVLWNTKLLSSNILLGQGGLTLALVASGLNPYYLLAFNSLIFVFCFTLKFKRPSNLMMKSRFNSYEHKYVISFKRIQSWSKLAKKYPELKWSPVGKKRCVLESLSLIDAEVQNFIMDNSFAVKVVEKMDLPVAKKYNIV